MAKCQSASFSGEKKGGGWGGDKQLLCGLTNQASVGVITRQMADCDNDLTGSLLFSLYHIYLIPLLE